MSVFCQISNPSTYFQFDCDLYYFCWFFKKKTTAKKQEINFKFDNLRSQNLFLSSKTSLIKHPEKLITPSNDQV